MNSVFIYKPKEDQTSGDMCLILIWIITMMSINCLI